MKIDSFAPILAASADGGIHRRSVAGAGAVGRPRIPRLAAVRDNERIQQ